MRKKAIHLISGNIINTVLNGLLGIWVARILGPEKRGIYALMLGSTGLISMFISFGAPYSSAYFIRKKPNTARTILRYLDSLLVIVAILTGLIIALGKNHFASAFLGGYQLNLLMSILLLAVVIIGTDNTVIGATLIAKGNARHFTLSNNAGTVTSFIITVGIASISTHKIECVLFGYMSGQFISTLMFRFYFKQYLEDKETSDQASLGLREFYGYGVKAQVGAFAALAIKRMDLFVVGYFTNPINVGYYAVGLALRDLALIVPRALAGLIGGEMAGQLRNDGKSALRLFNKSIKLNVAFNIGIILLSFLSIPFIIPVLYGSAYSRSTHPVLIIMASVLFLSTALLYASAINSFGKPLIGSMSSILSGMIGLPIIFFLTKIWGINGAAYSTIICTGIYLIVAYGFFMFFKKAYMSFNESDILPTSI